MKEPCCKECKGRVILIEGWSLEAAGYGYGTFKCLRCKRESSYYGEGLIFPKIKERRKNMIKKAKRFIGDLVEKIFKRMELHNIKLEASFLKDRVKELGETEKVMSETICLLTTGKAVNLTPPERKIIRSAIEYVPFREGIELPETKAQIRITWRDLREKITRSLVEEVNSEAKEDDETKAGDDG